VDLTHYIAGPYCTWILAMLGAEVIKAERPGQGDGARRLGPFVGDEPHLEKSIPFLRLNTNKKGITLNLKTTKGKEIFMELLRHGDVVVENFRPGVNVKPIKDFGYRIGVKQFQLHPTQECDTLTQR